MTGGPGADVDPADVDPAAALAVAQMFLDAVIWAEHLTVWDLLAPSAREVALYGAASRGLDAVAVERARQGTWTNAERDTLLGELVRGLTVDLGGARLDDLIVAAAYPRPDGRIEVQLEAHSTLPDTMTSGSGWSVARLVLVERSDVETWQVERIVR